LDEGKVHDLGEIDGYHTIAFPLRHKVFIGEFIVWGRRGRNRAEID